jgi:Rrf2 family protein
MPIKTRFVTAVQVLAIMAWGDKLETSQELGEIVGTHPAFLRRTISRLHRANLISSFPAPGGGSKIARSPKLISLGDIYRALNLRNELVLSSARGDAVKKVNAVLGEIHDNAQRAFEVELDRTTLASILKNAATKRNSKRSRSLSQPQA